MTNLVWRKSSYSVGDGNCVEVAPSPAAFMVRDSKNPTGPTLALLTAQWRRFLDTLNH